MFVFTPDSTIPMSYFNVPECIYDSKVDEWSNIYDKLEAFFKKYGVQCAIDSGFGKNERDFMVIINTGLFNFK